MDAKTPWETWLKNAEDQTVAVRREAVNVLSALKEDEPLKERALLHFLKRDPVPNIRAAAASALTTANPQTTAALIAASTDESAEVRLFACQSLGFEKPGSDVDLPAIHRALLARISDNGPGVARTAIRSLGRLRHRPATEPVIAYYRRHPHDARVAWTCAEALARLGETEVFFEAARVALRSENWNVRTFVVEAMPDVDSPRLVPFIIEHLTGEMERAVANHKAHRIEPRSFRLMIEVLKTRTGKWFGADVDGWIGWLERSDRGLLPAQPIRRPAPALQEAFDAIWREAYPGDVVDRSAKIPDLLDALKAAAKRGDGYVPIRIELAAIGAPVVEPLVRVIADDASPIQEHACWALYRVRDPAAVPLLIEHLKHPHALVRKWCANTFAAMHEPRAVEPLLVALDDANWEVRSAAAWALGHIKEARPGAIEPLIVMLTGDPRWEVRLQAAAALGRLAPSDPAAHEALEGAAEGDENPSVRKTAAQTLAESFDALFGELASPDPVKRVLAARALARMKATEAIPALIAMLGDPAAAQVAPNERIFPREAAVDALVTMGEPAVEPLVDALASKNSLVQQNAMRALGHIGDPRAILPLIAGLEDKSTETRTAAREALVAIGASAVKPLVLEFKEPRTRFGDFQYEVTSVLVKIGAPAMAPLAEVFRTENQEVRISAGKALVEMGAPAVPTLVALLKDPKVEVRRWAAYFLGEMRERARGAVASLIEALKDREYVIRCLSAYALGKVGDAQAVEPLIAALHDEHWNVRNGAATALGELKDARAVGLAPDPSAGCVVGVGDGLFALLVMREEVLGVILVVGHRLAVVLRDRVAVAVIGVVRRPAEGDLGQEFVRGVVLVVRGA